MKIERGSDLLDQIFNLITRYIWKVHSDEHIRKIIGYSAGRSFLDIIGPSDKAMCYFPGYPIFVQIVSLATSTK